ncbi:36641_t:CDS:2, partial [Gigaspora margarita]
MNVLFPNTLRRSQSVTLSSSILQEDLYFMSLNDWSYLPPLLAKPQDNYEFELHKDGLNLLPAYFENGKFPFVQQQSHDIPIYLPSIEKAVSRLLDFENFHCLSNEKFPKSKSLDILIDEIGEQIFDDAASKFCSTFIDDDINALFANISADDMQKVWRQFLVNIDIATIYSESNGSNDFEKSLLDI